MDNEVQKKVSATLLELIDRAKPLVMRSPHIIEDSSGEHPQYLIMVGRGVPWGGAIPHAISGLQFAESSISIYASAFMDGAKEMAKVVLAASAAGLFSTDEATVLAAAEQLMLPPDNAPGSACALCRKDPCVCDIGALVDESIRASEEGKAAGEGIVGVDGTGAVGLPPRTH